MSPHGESNRFFGLWDGLCLCFAASLLADRSFERFGSGQSKLCTVYIRAGIDQSVATCHGNFRLYGAVPSVSNWSKLNQKNLNRWKEIGYIFQYGVLMEYRYSNQSNRNVQQNYASIIDVNIILIFMSRFEVVVRVNLHKAMKYILLQLFFIFIF